MYNMSACTFLSGAPAGAIPASSRVVYIPNGAATVAYVDARITANSAVVVTQLTVDGTSVNPRVSVVTPGTGLTIIGTGNVALAAPGWPLLVTVLKY